MSSLYSGVQETFKYNKFFSLIFAKSQNFSICATVPYSGVLKMSKSNKILTLIHFTYHNTFLYDIWDVKKWSSQYGILVSTMVIISKVIHYEDVCSARLTCNIRRCMTQVSARAMPIPKFSIFFQGFPEFFLVH
jgi:hypothetical protein